MAGSSDTERASVYVSVDSLSVTEQEMWCVVCAETPSDTDRVLALMCVGGGDDVGGGGSGAGRGGGVGDG